MSLSRVLARLAVGALLVGLALWLAALGAVVVAAHRDAARPAAAIIVLGAAQYDGRPSPVLRARLDHGIALWRQGLAPWLIFTGGRRAGDRTSEAATGRRYAVAQGVPDSVILLESEGRTTDESLRAAAALLAEMERTGSGLARRTARAARAARADAADAADDEARDDPAARTPDADDRDAPGGRRVLPAGTRGRRWWVDSPPAHGGPPRSAILVSDPFHMLRLGVLARRHGIVAYGSPTPTSPISARPPLAWRYMLRESLKVPFVILLEQSSDDEQQ